MGKILNIVAIYCLVVLSIVGNYYRMQTSSNIILIVLILLIALSLIAVIFDYIKEEYFPYLIHSISLCLLFHQSLAVPHIFGNDIFYEKNIIDIVINDHYWHPALYANLNAMLSLTMLAPSLSLITNLSIEQTLKLIYPFIYSFVPLLLYITYTTYVSKKYAFLSAFLFMSFWPFFTELLQLARQMIAELILAFLLLYMPKSRTDIRYKLLILIFLFTLATSHYGTNYLFLFVLVSAYLLHAVLNQRTEAVLGVNFLILYIVLTLSWYIYVSSSSIFDSILTIGQHIAQSLSEGFMTDNYQARTAVGVVDPSSFSSMRIMKLVLQYIVQLMIFSGVIYSLLRKKHKDTFFYTLSYVMLILLLMSVMLPIMAGKFNMTRIFHFTLFVLSPFFMIGLSFLLQVLKTKTRLIFNFNLNQSVNTLSALILVLYFFSSTGLLYDLTGDIPGSIPLGLEKLKAIGMNEDISSKNIVATLGSIPTDSDIASSIWLKKKTRERLIHSDKTGPLMLMGYAGIGNSDLMNLWSNLEDHEKNNYLYFRTFNLAYNFLLKDASHNTASIDVILLSDYFNSSTTIKHKIYSTKNNDIYLVR